MPVSIFGSTSNTGTAERKVRVSEPINAPLNMNGKPIINLPFPDEETNAANKQYVDDKINNLDVELKQYVDDKINNLDDELKQYINSIIEEKVKIAIASFTPTFTHL